MGIHSKIAIFKKFAHVKLGPGTRGAGHDCPRIANSMVTVCRTNAAFIADAGLGHTHARRLYTTKGGATQTVQVVVALCKGPNPATAYA